ncbi:glucosyltransferase [Staphylococcus aureus]|nr:glucosyltransferase [Staphylococcus aureus]
MKTIQLHKTTLILIAILLFYTFMGILLPLMHDDLQWFSNYNTDILKVGFASLNGRYIGNIFEIIAVHVSWLRWLSYGLISMGIIWMIMHITRCKAWTSYYLLAFSLMLILPSAIYADTYGWFAGFYNYATSTLISLFIIYYCINAIIYKEKQPVSVTVLFYVLSFFGQLFMENVTLFHCIILILAFLYEFTANRTLNYKLLFSFMIATIGTIIMFSNPNYRKILFEGSEYQQVSNNQGIFSKFAEMISTSLPYGVIFSQVIILSMIAALIIYLLLRSDRYVHLTILKRRIIMIGFITLPLYYLLFYNQFLLNKNTDIGLVGFANIIVCGYFAFSIFVGIYLSINNRKT